MATTNKYPKSYKKEALEDCLRSPSLRTDLLSITRPIPSSLVPDDCARVLCAAYEFLVSDPRLCFWLVPGRDRWHVRAGLYSRGVVSAQNERILWPAEETVQAHADQQEEAAYSEERTHTRTRQPIPPGVREAFAAIFHDLICDPRLLLRLEHDGDRTELRADIDSDGLLPAPSSGDLRPPGEPKDDNRPA